MSDVDIIPIDQVEAWEPGNLFTMTQVVRVDGGLLSTPSPGATWQQTADRLRQQLGKMGYVAVLDLDVDGPLDGHPFAQVAVEQAWRANLDLISTWERISDDPATGEPRFRFVFTWYLVEVTDPDPGVMQAGWPALAAAVVLVGVFLFGTYKVVEQFADQVVPHLPDAEDVAEVVREGTAALATIGAVLVLLFIVTR